MTAAEPFRVPVPTSASPRTRLVVVAAGTALLAGAAGISPSAPAPTTAAGLSVLLLCTFAAVMTAAYPAHEAVHWLAFAFCGAPARDIQLHLASCNAAGTRLSRRRYTVVLTAPYPMLIAAAWLCPRHELTVPAGLALTFVLPLTAIKDTTRLAGVMRAPTGLWWEDVSDAALGWPNPAPTNANTPLTPTP